MTRFYAGIGSRRTPANVLGVIHDLAGDLRRLNWTLRTGHAEGADQAFEYGAGLAACVFLPWPTYNGQEPIAGVHYGSPDARAYTIAQEVHPAWWTLTLGGTRMHARNSHIVLGKSLADPVRFVVAWTPGGKVTGGTGQALRLAAKLAIPVFNLATCTADEVVRFARGVAA